MRLWLCLLLLLLLPLFCREYIYILYVPVRFVAFVFLVRVVLLVVAAAAVDKRPLVFHLLFLPSLYE